MKNTIIMPKEYVKLTENEMEYEGGFFWIANIVSDVIKKYILPAMDLGPLTG